MTFNASTLFDLESKTVVITGGYGQIGQAMVRGLLDLNARVAIVEPFVSDEKTQDIFGSRVNSAALAAFAGDVTDKQSLEAACAQITHHFSAPDGLINNAALDSPPDSSAADSGPFEEFPVESWEKVMDVNVKGVFLSCQVFGGRMAEIGRGSVINIASIYGTVSPDQTLYQYRRDRGEVFYKPSPYSASKSALYNFTRYLAVYWGPRNVRCNTLTFAGVFNHQDPEFLAGYKKKIPLRRGDDFTHLQGMARAEDYVGPSIFLLSEASAYVTGADIRVDGGFLSI